MRNLLLNIIAVILVLNVYSQNPPKRELRGAWISTYFGLDWPNRTQPPATQRDAFITLMNHHKVTGINAVYFQIRSQCDAMYPSTIEPWSNDLTGVQGTPPNPLWDPLQFALGEARKRGMEFHAWLNPYRAVGNTANLPTFAASHVAKQHPEWMLTIGTLQILNPGLPAVRDYITNVVVDILTRYDIDGIHFDDYFYPTGTIPDAATFTAYPRGFTNISDWRRDNINLLIQRVSDEIKNRKPWVKFGVSPSGIYRSHPTNPAIGSATSAGALQHYLNHYADSRKWLEMGWADYLAPQLYWYIGQPGSDYGVLVPWWNNNAYGRHIYIGMAAYKVNDPAQGVNWALRSQIPNQLRMNRNALYPNVQGEIYFRTQNLRNNPLNFRDSIRLHFYQKPALLPRMPWKDNIAPAPASSLTAVKYGNDSVVLNWVKPPATPDELNRVRQFVVYRSTVPVIDIENANNIVVITPNDTTAYADKSILPNTVYYYTVTALDRLHNESVVSNTSNNLPPAITCPADQQVILNNSCIVALPDYTAQGTVVSSAPVTVSQSPAPGTTITGMGVTTVTLTATDAGGNSGTCTFNVTAIDNADPVITGAVADPSMLWPPNHKMRKVSVNYDVTDNCGPVVTTLTVTSDEPEYGLSAGDEGPDWEIINNHQVKLRAERDGNGDGRIYTITITATDLAGNVSTESVYVTVPHDNGHLITNTRPIEGRLDQKDMSDISVKVNPNPSDKYFSLLVSSPKNGYFNMRVTDVWGREIESRRRVNVNSQLEIGRNYRPGIYFIEIVQGQDRKVIKLIKTHL